MALWIGGLAVLAGFALRGPERGTARASPPWPRAVPRFSSIALGCVVAIVASGVYQTWREVGSWSALARHDLRPAGRRQGHRPALPDRARLPRQAADPARPVRGRRCSRSAGARRRRPGRPGTARRVAGHGEPPRPPAVAGAPAGAARRPGGTPPPGGPRSAALGADPAAAAPVGRGRAGHRRGHPRAHRRAGEHRDRPRVLRAHGQREPGVQHRRAGRRGHRARVRRRRPGSGRTRSRCTSPGPTGRRSSRRR